MKFIFISEDACVLGRFCPEKNDLQSDEFFKVLKC